MNKKTGYILRIVLGGYLVWIGVNLLIQMLNERPSNMILLCIAAGVFIATGLVYAVFYLLKVSGVRFRIKKKEAAAEPEQAEQLGQTREIRPAVSHVRMQDITPAPSDMETQDQGKEESETEENEPERQEEPAGGNEPEMAKETTTEAADDAEEGKDEEDIQEKDDVEILDEESDFEDEELASEEEEIEIDYEEK